MLDSVNTRQDAATGPLAACRAGVSGLSGDGLASALRRLGF
jgi:hypothetical protein